MEGVTYAKYEEGKELADLGMRGNWFHVMQVDAVGIAHPTDDRWAARAAYEDGYEAHKIVEWPTREVKDDETPGGKREGAQNGTRPRRKESTPRGAGRVTGPVRSTFPRPTGWKVDGKPVNLGLVTVKDLTRVFTDRKFKRSTAEEGWQKRIGADLVVNFQKAWKVRGLFSTPRDSMRYVIA